MRGGGKREREEATDRKTGNRQTETGRDRYTNRQKDRGDKQNRKGKNEKRISRNKRHLVIIQKQTDQLRQDGFLHRIINLN